MSFLEVLRVCFVRTQMFYRYQPQILAHIVFAHELQVSHVENMQPAEAAWRRGFGARAP